MPDPTALTAAAVTAATDQLRREMQALREIISARIDGADSDRHRIHEDVKAQLRLGEVAIGHLKDLMETKIERLAAITSEKFAGVNSQFEERDTRTDQRAGDTKLAVDAAFAAAKEATAKIETGFTKQIDAMSDQIDTKTRNSEDKISDLKDRLNAISARIDRGEGTVIGSHDQRTEARLTSGSVVGIVGGVIALVSLLAVIITGVVENNNSSKMNVPPGYVLTPTLPK